MFCAGSELGRGVLSRVSVGVELAWVVESCEWLVLGRHSMSRERLMIGRDRLRGDDSW